MSIAEKLTIIAENQQNVYDAGYAKGKADGGIDWDLFQDYGSRTNYTYAFLRNWYDDIYNPKYPIGGGNINQAYLGSKITDTKVPIVVKGTASSCFQDADIKIIRSLDLTDCTNISNAFYSAVDLESVTFVGSIKINGLSGSIEDVCGFDR